MFWSRRQSGPFEALISRLFLHQHSIRPWLAIGRGGAQRELCAWRKGDKLLGTGCLDCFASSWVNGTGLMTSGDNSMNWVKGTKAIVTNGLGMRVNKLDGFM